MRDYLSVQVMNPYNVGTTSLEWVSPLSLYRQFSRTIVSLSWFNNQPAVAEILEIFFELEGFYVYIWIHIFMSGILSESCTTSNVEIER